MDIRDPEQSRIPVSPSLDAAMNELRTPIREPTISTRVVYMTGIAVVIGVAAGIVAVVLAGLIGLITNFAFFGRFGTDLVAPAGGRGGWWLLVIPTLGGLIVGLMARYGSAAIRGHGIPRRSKQFSSAAVA